MSESGGRCHPSRLRAAIGAVHKVLTRTTYVGRHRFNTKFWKTRERKPDAEVVEMAVAPIVDAAEFEAVQALLKSRSPALTAPRVVSGPTLLTGVCFCAACGNIPQIVTAKFERAQKLHLLTWIDFDLIKAGELVALTALELALKDR